MIQRCSSSFTFSFFSISLASSSSYSSNSTHRCPAIQSHALFMFKHNLFSTKHSDDDDDHYVDWECRDWLGSGYYPITMSWKMSTDCCNWDGVKCNHFTGDVIGLDLSCGMLRGTIHPNTTLFHLPHLQRLNLAFNNFSGSRIPHEIGRLSNSLTHLNVSGCNLRGQIPSEVLLLSKLVSLDLSDNLLSLQNQPHIFNSFLQNYTLLRDLSLSSVNISLVLPYYLNISSALKSLNLPETSLHGKLPDNIFNLQYLEKLDLSSNYVLAGAFLEVNTSTSIPLKWLDLSENYGLTVELFDSIDHLKYLSYLDLSYSNLSGKIPDSIGHLKSLNYLDLSYNNLSGEIPDSIGHLKYLNTLRLCYCELVGLLPKSLGNLSHLTTLWLSGNKLNGTLPSWLFTLPLLENLYLDKNLFHGILPSEMFNHQSLRILILNHNQFDIKIDVLDQDPISQSFLQLTNLTTLDLSFNNFEGVWELDTLLSSLTTLDSLDLSYSGLLIMSDNALRYVNPEFDYLRLASSGLKVFPNTLRSMKKISFLDLSRNEIDGRVPHWAGEIGENDLYYLDISHNLITGLPHLHWNKIEYLFLQSNKIQGPFPSLICNTSGLSYLDLSDNRFGGLIPRCFGSNISGLRTANLGNNYFKGAIPNTYKDCGQLEMVSFNGNQLEGELPSSLSKCRQLKVLDMGNNRLNETFPDWLGSLSLLQVLVLRSNNFHGSINTSPTRKFSFPSLMVFDLSHNGFVGHLPQNYFQSFNSMKHVFNKSENRKYWSMGFGYYSMVVAMKGVEQIFLQVFVDYTIVDLSNNKFEGDIPDDIGSLTSLIVLNLSNNSLTGQIPDALGNISEIESLDLSSNQLTGKIPQSLVSLTFLEFLDLSQNHLVGCIPSGTQFSTFNASFGGNPGLCGFPLPNPCEHKSSSQLKADEDDESGFTWNSVMLGSGCGILIGLVMGYLMLSTGRPKWFIAICNCECNRAYDRQKAKQEKTHIHWEMILVFLMVKKFGMEVHL